MASDLTFSELKKHVRILQAAQVDIAAGLLIIEGRLANLEASVGRHDAAVIESAALQEIAQAMAARADQTVDRDAHDRVVESVASLRQDVDSIRQAISTTAEVHKLPRDVLPSASTRKPFRPEVSMGAVKRKRSAAQTKRAT